MVRNSRIESVGPSAIRHVITGFGSTIKSVDFKKKMYQNEKFTDYFAAAEDVAFWGVFSVFALPQIAIIIAQIPAIPTHLSSTALIPRQFWCLSNPILHCGNLFERFMTVDSDD
jgi:hypothetical protein